MQTTAARSHSAGSLMDLLLRSGEALRNWRALATLMATGVATIVIFLALASSGKPFLVFLGALLAWLIASVGVSATGILLMDQALGMAPRAIGAALIDGLFAALRLFVLVLIGFAVGLVAVIAVSILLLLCKIPGIGGLLYAIILPASVLTMAFVYAGLYFMASLAGPAVWSGASIRQAAAALYLVIKNRLVESALGVILLSFLMAFIGILVGTFIGGGTMVVGGLSAAILGSSLKMSGLGMLLGGMGGFGGYGGYGGYGGGEGLVYGGLFGLGILFAMVGAVLFTMVLLGINRLYLHLTADLDLAGAEAALAQRLQEAKQRAADMQEEARRRADEMRQRSQSQTEPVLAPAAATAAAPAVVQPAAAPACPACQATVTPGDKFCESCGHKLG
jgi:hypothetical protein